GAARAALHRGRPARVAGGRQAGRGASGHAVDARSAAPARRSAGGRRVMSLLEGYRPLPGTHDEVFGQDGEVRPPVAKAFAAFSCKSAEEFSRSQQLAELALLNQGVTFSVFNDQRGTEKIFPFCLLPRPISAADWARLERGLIQRIRALSLFLDDVYGEQVI